MILPDLPPSTIASAIEENAVEGVKAWARWPEMEIHEDAAILWTATDIPFFVFNNVLRLRAAPTDTDAIIDNVLARARSRNVPIAWWITPSTQPADLGERLEAKGFNHAATLQGMAANLLTLDESLPKPRALTIEPVSESEALKTWCQVMTAVNEFPESAEHWFEMYTAMGLGTDMPWRHYLASIDGTAVATSSLFLGAGVAGIHSVATVPDARREGIGTEVTLEPLREARRLGYRVGTLFSSEMAVNLYRRIGFREYCEANLYLWIGH